MRCTARPDPTSSSWKRSTRRACPPSPSGRKTEMSETKATTSAEAHEREVEKRTNARFYALESEVRGLRTRLRLVGMGLFAAVALVGALAVRPELFPAALGLQ